MSIRAGHLLDISISFILEKGEEPYLFLSSFCLCNLLMIVIENPKQHGRRALNDNVAQLTT